MKKEMINKMINLYNKLDDIGWDISQAKTELCDLEKKIENSNSNSIKDIENLKRELKRYELYSEKLEDFLENYMEYYNN